jgi:hypothetical protein
MGHFAQDPEPDPADQNHYGSTRVRIDEAWNVAIAWI